MQNTTPSRAHGLTAWLRAVSLGVLLLGLPAARAAGDEGSATAAAPPASPTSAHAAPTAAANHSAAPAQPHDGSAVEPPPGAGPVDANAQFPVPAPPLSDGIFPCSECHADMEVNRERRQLGEHTEIELNHGPRERWCFDCHNPEDRDHLRLASGALVPFTESYRLCGQCHGPKLRDWQVGVHGKRVGEWDGKKRYLLCAHCHNPHAPHFKPIEPMPPPKRPADIR